MRDNLAALWATEPRLAEAIECLEEQDEYPVEPSKSGPPTVAVRTPDGRRVYLHSRYQPLEEAQRLIDPIEIAEKTTFHVLGLGLGYHLQLLFERASEEAIFCIFEPDLRMIRTALWNRDLPRRSRSHRLLWFWRGEKAEMFQRLTPHTALISMGAKPCACPQRAAAREFFPPGAGLARRIRLVLPHQHEHARLQQPQDGPEHRAQRRLVRGHAQRCRGSPIATAIALR